MKIVFLALGVVSVSCQSTEEKAVDAGVDQGVLDLGSPQDLGHDLGHEVGPLDQSFDLRTADLGAARLIVTPSVLTTNETGQSATVEVWLESPPLEPVYVAIGPPTMEGAVDATQLVFLPGDYDVPQTVTVTGADDALVDGPQTYTLRFTTTSDDARYDGLEEVVAVTNFDDDGVGVTVTPTALRVSEAGVSIAQSATFSVALDSDPGETVVVELVSSDATELAVAPAQLTFDGTNASTPQIVTVTANSDGVPEPARLVSIATTMSATQAYAGVDPHDVEVSVFDEDLASIHVDPITLTTIESGTTATFEVRLDAPPTNDVQVPLTCTDITEGSCYPTQMTFTPANWSVPQTATVTGLADAVADGDVSYAVEVGPSVSMDPAYTGVRGADVEVLNLDF